MTFRQLMIFIGILVGIVVAMYVVILVLQFTGVYQPATNITGNYTYVPQTVITPKGWFLV